MMPCVLFQLYVESVECLLENCKEISDVLFIDSAKRTEAKSVSCADFAWMDGNPTFVAIVVYFLEVPVWMIGIEHRHHKPRLPFMFVKILQSSFLNTFVNCIEHSA